MSMLNLSGSVDQLNTVNSLPHYKCVVVGDGGVGKTSMIVRFVQGDFFDEYAPTDFDSFTMPLTSETDCLPCTLTLVDTAGQETYDRLRALTYYDADVFVLCFSVACPDSFINVTSRWLPELKEFKPKTPIILVGTQTDLRRNSPANVNTTNTSSSKSSNDSSNTSSSSSSSSSPSKQKRREVSYKSGKRLANKINAKMYTECSALNGDGLEGIFRKAIFLASSPKKKRKFWHRMKRMFATHA